MLDVQQGNVMATCEGVVEEELSCSDVGEHTAAQEEYVSLHEPIPCGGCGLQVCDRFFLLAAGRAWHNSCLRCSQCQCQLQTQPTLYYRDGHIYCHHDYSRLFCGRQCARCFQPILGSELVMWSAELSFHPHCFSCQECEVKLPGNLYYMQGSHLYCHTHHPQTHTHHPQTHTHHPQTHTHHPQTHTHHPQTHTHHKQTHTHHPQTHTHHKQTHTHHPQTHTHHKQTHTHHPQTHTHHQQTHTHHQQTHTHHQQTHTHHPQTHTHHQQTHTHHQQTHTHHQQTHTHHPQTHTHHQQTHTHHQQTHTHLRDDESGVNTAFAEGEESVSSSELRLDQRPDGGRVRSRSKRIRTCFGNEQLRALESYFSQEQNPNGKDWNNLVHQTNLPKKVLQVWFRNARAKLRRSDDSPKALTMTTASASPLRTVTAATASPPPPSLVPLDRPLVFPTIDQWQLLQLTSADQWQQLLPSPDSQVAPGCVSYLEEFGDFGDFIEHL